MTHSPVTIQITPEPSPSTPSCMGEVAAFARVLVLTHVGSLKAIQEHVRFARARFGTYDLIDFVAGLIGYAHAARSDRCQSFYERLAPFAEPFMALGWCETSCPIAQPFPVFAARLDQPTVEALRTLCARG